MIKLLLATLVATQVQVKATAGRDSTDRQGASVQISLGAASQGTGARIPVTAEHLATAFRTPAARDLLLRARVARFTQDSALRSYEAKVRQRISVGGGLGNAVRDRLMLRDEGVARVQWDRDHGAVVDLLGKRTTVPMAYDDEANIDSLAIRQQTSLPIPYFPGRETLWIGGSMAQVEVDATEIVHPLAEGSEAYYTYAIGDSVVFTLPNGSQITLRELRVQARQPHWNVIVGSFWFDAATAQLVRAVYRLSVEADLWTVAAEEAERDEGDGPPAWARALVGPMRASLQVITSEASLFEGRFWLPVSQAAEGNLKVNILRVGVTFEERYEYPSVNRPVDVASALAGLPEPPPTFDYAGLRDSLRRAGVPRRTADTILARRGREWADSLPERRARQRLRDSLTAAGTTAAAINEALRELSRQRSDSVRALYERQCTDPAAQTATRYRRYDGTLDVVLRVPCDLSVLRNSPELPPSPYEPGEEIFGREEREELLSALDFGLQAGWGPSKPSIEWGFSQTRYNRVEGLGTGVALRQHLGKGLSWTAQLRASQGDREVNGELGIERSNGRTTYHLNAYRRLVSANDWGSPLTFGSSFITLLTARDEGFYYRALGGELRQTRAGGRLTLRAFAEEHSNAPVTTRFSVFGGSHDDGFIENVQTERERFYGASMRYQDNLGLDPRGWQALADFRAEGAGGARRYGRVALDLSVSRTVVRGIAVGVTGAGGTSAGDVPPQRGWFLGGAHTVRGQRAGSAAGNAFWFSRLEIARERGPNRLSLFGDLGWAGDRSDDWGRSQRLLSGVGIGTSFVQGLVRFDLARGLWPREAWRFYSLIEAPF